MTTATKPAFSDDASVEATATRPEIRVLVVAPSLAILGGQAVQAALLTERLRREPGLAVSFLAVNPSLSWPLHLLQRIKFVRTLVTSTAYVLHLFWKLPHYDIIHVFSASYLSFLLAPTPALLVAKAFRKKVVLNYHSGEAEDHLTRWPSAVRIARLADAIVVQSQYLVDVFARFGLSARAVCNAVETERFLFRERARVRPVFFSNRNFEDNYNVPCVVRAFGVIQAQRPDARLVLAGDGSRRADIVALIAKLGLRNVTLLGLLPPPRMPEIYDEADVFLNGSDVDNMPLSILEAFASGLPVVTTDAGGIPRIVTDGESALMVPKGDYAALGRAALRLLEDDGLALQLSRSGFTESRRYQWARIREDWLALYAELALARRRARRSYGESTR